MLGLFAFILAEKNAHGHSSIARQGETGHAVVHTVYSCLICEFQLAADTDLPVLPEAAVPEKFSFSRSISLPQFFSSQFPLAVAGRGPPSYC